jgi:hypothetical protein
MGFTFFRFAALMICRVGLCEKLVEVDGLRSVLPDHRRLRIRIEYEDSLREKALPFAVQGPSDLAVADEAQRLAGGAVDGLLDVGFK